MKTLRLYAPGDLSLCGESISNCYIGETLPRVNAVGTCGSDLHWFSEGEIGDAILERPLI
jgi:L-iditol 2-dehydrogenase